MGEKIIAVNRKAQHDYFILETYEAGLMLTGGEVKSIREGKVNIKDSFGRIEKGEGFLYNMHISPYFYDHSDYNPLRTRKLLLHREEINRLTGKITQKGLTLIPLRLYFKKGVAKVEIGLAKGKKLYDKRQALKKKAVKMEVDRAVRGRE